MVCLYVQKFQPVGAAAQADGLGALQGVDAVAALDPLGQGFVAGGNVTVITTIGGNVIVNVKEARVAISKEMAQKIMI